MSAFTLLYNGLGKQIRNPDKKVVRKVTIRIPDSPVFGGILYMKTVQSSQPKVGKKNRLRETVRKPDCPAFGCILYLLLKIFCLTRYVFSSMLDSEMGFTRI
jgi:hypothetical protein